MYNFNAITEAREKEVVAKFKEYGVGINMQKYTSGYGSSDTAKWSDLTDSTLYSVNAIKTKMLEIARTINTNCNDEFLGDLSTAFTIRDHKEKLVKFTYEEMYIFLRAALRFQKETADYKRKKKELAELNAFIESKKSDKEKVAEAKRKLKVLAKEVDEE